MFVLSDTHTFTPSVVNVARFGYMRFDGYAVIAQPINAADVGMATPAGLPQTPGLVVNGLFTIGTAGQPFYWQNTNTYVWQDTVSLTRGMHSLRMGAEAKRHQVDVNVPYVNDGFLFLLGFPDFLLGQSGGTARARTEPRSAMSSCRSARRASSARMNATPMLPDSCRTTSGCAPGSQSTPACGTRSSGLHPISRAACLRSILRSRRPMRRLQGTLSGFVLPGNYRARFPTAWCARRTTACGRRPLKMSRLGLASRLACPARARAW